MPTIWLKRAIVRMPDFADPYLPISMLLGLIVASFIGLVSLRLPQEQPIVLARSACASCGRKLGPLDLAPILSFLLLRGRCRTCGGRIPRRYLLLELACPLLPLWAAVAGRAGPELLAAGLLGWTLLLLALLDGEHFWLPDSITLPLGAVGLAVAGLAGWPALQDALVGAAIGFVFFLALAWVYSRVRGREGLGGGDARLLGAAGAWVGWIGLASVLLWASLAGLSLVAAQALLGRAPRADQPIPFGIFLALGLWLTWLFGPLGLQPGAW